MHTPRLPPPEVQTSKNVIYQKIYHDERSQSLIIITLRFVGLYPDKNTSPMKKIWTYTLYFLDVLLTVSQW